MCRMAMFEQWFEQDLAEKIEIRHCESVVFTGDSESNVVGVRVFKRGEPLDDNTLTVGASIIRADGTTVEADGTLSYNSASIEIPAAALAIEGPIAVHIYLSDGDEMRATVFAGVFTVVATSTGAIIDPGTIIPSINALIAELQEKIVYLDKLENVAVTVTTLEPGTSATGSVTQTSDTTTFAFGIPKGAKGDTGNTGATGPVAAFSIGTVTTLAAGSDATASITGTDAAPVLNLGIPQGAKGDTGPQGPSASINDNTTDTTSTWSSSKVSAELGAIIDDTDTAADSTWSSDKIAGMIDDANVEQDSTWSSYKITEELGAKLDASAIVEGSSPVSYIKIGLIVIAWGTINVSATSANYPSLYSGLFSAEPAVSVTYAKTGSNVSGSFGAIKVSNLTAYGFSVVAAGTQPSSATPACWIAIGPAGSGS